MSEKQYLRQSAILSVSALILLLAIGLISNLAEYNASQELFETIISQTDYKNTITDAAPTLRVVLFLDSLFILLYTSAICFAALAFKPQNTPVAWFVIIGIIAVMLFDYWENFTMAQSIDLLQIDEEISIGRITHQAIISAFKWQLSAIVLFSVSFVLPCEYLIEKLLVWGTRMGLAIGSPLFIINPLNLRELGIIIIASSMIGGFVLLAIVTWKRSLKTIGATQ